MREGIFALGAAAVMTFIVAIAFRRHSSGPRLLGFFLVFFLFAWAGGLWVVPAGLPMYDILWLTFLAVVLLLAFLLSLLLPSEAIHKGSQEGVRPAYILLFWILVMILALAIVAHYLAFSGPQEGRIFQESDRPIILPPAEDSAVGDSISE